MAGPGQGEGVAVSEMTADFVRLVRDALDRLHDPVALQTHPLARVLPLAYRGGADRDRQGRALRRWLLDALGALQPAPPPGVGPAGVGPAGVGPAGVRAAERRVRLLRLRYLEALAPVDVRNRLGLSKAQYFRQQAVAVAAVGSLLWRQGPTIGAAVPEADAGGAFLTAASAGLPTPLTSFVGRERELALLADRLGSARLVTLTGPGGVGKTRLAVQAAVAARGAFGGGVAFVSLAPIRDPGLVAATVAQALGVRDAAGRPALAGLAAALRRKPLLLVLDNFEQVLPAAPVVAALLAACPQLTVLVTSRALLRLSGEHDVAVAPLSVPPPGAAATSEVLERAEATRLFLERARAARAELAVTAGDAAAIAQVCRRLDGLPLAIELAAARVRLLPPRALLARLERRLPLLTGGPRDAPARQQTLRATIAWSDELLEPDERTLLRRLAVFAGGCTLGAAAVVCTPATAAPAAVAAQLDGLDSLVGKSLLHAGTSPAGEPRFGMLETVREYALEQLEASGEAAALRWRHARYYAGLAAEARRDLASPQPVAVLDRLEAELDNFRAVLGWEEARGAGGETAAGLTAALCQFWYLRGYVAEGQHWVRAALTLPAAAGPTALRAELLGEGVGYWFQGDDDLARSHLEESVAIFRERGDARRLATMLHRLGQVVHRRGAAAAAAELHEEALALARAAGDDYTVAFALVGLGNVALEQGGRADARGYYDEALALRRRLGHTWGVAHALNSLADLARAEGDNARAADLLRECLVLRRAIGDRGNLVLTLGELAGTNAALGQPARAARLFGAAEALRERTGVRLASPADRAEADRRAAHACAALGASEFAAAWAAGQRMTLEEAVTYALDHPAPDAAAGGGAGGLTAREREVATLVARGLTNRAIAAALVISERTADTHVERILGKLGFRRRAQIAAWTATQPPGASTARRRPRPAVGGPRT
jgi:non-specific serine/threonine protein kinase